MKKIFIGFENIASMITDYKMGFESLGLRTITAVYQSSPIQHTVVDYNFAELIRKMDVAASQEAGHKNRNESVNRLKRQIWERSLRECDIFIFIWSSFNPDFSEYAELKKRGKKIVTFFVGSDIRWIPAMEQEFDKFNIWPPEFDSSYRRVPLINKLNYLRIAEKYSDFIGSDPDMSQLALRPYFNLGMPLWLEKFRENCNQRKIPKIIHAPSSRGTKGTKYVLDVFEALKSEGLKFETELIENLPNLEAIKKYEDSDILVGQLFSTYGGRQEHEALACGSIVLSGFTPDYALDYINKNSRHYQKVKEYPIVSVDPNSLYHELKKIIQDYPRRIEIAKMGPPYVKKYHDATKLASRTLDLLEQDNAEPDFYPTFFRNGFIPESNEVAIFNHYTEMVKECSWYKRHVMPGERCRLIFPDPRRSVPTSTSPRKEDAPIKLLYLAFVNTNYEQILTKIDQQFKAIKAICDNSDCYVVGIKNSTIDFEKFCNINYIELKKTDEPYSLKEYYSVCEEIAQNDNYDIIYFRYPLFNKLTYEFVSKFDNVVFEHQSIVENEISPPEAEIEKKFAPFILAKARGIVAVTDEILTYELSRTLKTIPGHVMSNGIDTDSIGMLSPHYHPNKLHLFCASHFSPWHGIDRLIDGLELFNDHTSITLHLAGEGPEIARYKKMVQEYGLEERVIFYGRLNQKQIDEITKYCQIAIGSLALHRIHLNQFCVLKNREYCLRGIPFVYAGEDVDFYPELPFVRIFAANDEPIDIQVLVDFADEIARHPEIREQERQYAMDNLQWGQRIQQLMPFIEGLVKMGSNKTPVFEAPKSVEEYINEIVQALRGEDIGLALRICKEALTEYKQQPSMWLAYGTILRLLERNDEAVTALKHSLHLFESPDALLELFHVLHLLGRHKDKERIKDRLVKQYPSWTDKVKKIDSVPNTDVSFVSIIIPCYNQAQYLPDAVASVVAQTYQNWECIIVNDGSPDNTTDVAGELISKYPDKKIRLMVKTNGGLADARNAGIKVSQGKYWIPLDSDDMMAPTLLEKTVQILDNNPTVGFAYADIQHFGGANNLFPLPDFDAHTVIHIDNICCVCSLVRRAVWEEVGGYNVNMKEGYEDWDFWVGCIEKGWKGYRIPEALFMYRKTGSSMLGSANEKRKELIARMVLNHPSLYSQDRQSQAKAILGEKRIIYNFGEKKNSLQITYLISSLLGVTGGNITLLNQVNALSERGHHLTIVTYTDKPQWIDIKARIIRVPQAQPMAPYVPASHAVISTYFTNTAELVNIDASVKIYYAQGDQYIFEDDTPSPNPQVEQQRRRMCRLSKDSYLYPNVHFVPNSRNLADAVERAYGKKPDAILPVCTDQLIFRPLQKPVVGSKWRILIVGPDRRGSDLEPLSFKGIDDIRKGLEKLSKQFNNFTTIRMSNTEPDIFKDFPCEFYFCPSDELKTFLYGTAHILVYASHYDSCPRPPQEAMAAGTAVVSTATPGAMEYCRDKENCLLVPIKSPEAIADAVAHLIKDGSLRERLVKGGFATARNFPCEREWNELEALLYRFMEESGKTLEDTRIPPAKENSGLYQNIQSLIDAGQSREAIIALKRLLISHPDFALAHNDLGVLYVNSDKKEKALSHYEQAVQLQPENITFQKNLADFLYVESGRVEDALQIYVNILAADPEDVETLLITGHICVALKKLDDARHFYQRVLEIEPGNPDAGQNLKALENYVKSDKAIGSDSVSPGRDSKEEGCVENKRPAIFNSGADNYEYKVSILISLDGIHKHIRDCVKSIQRHTSETHEIVFLDNGSIKSILKWVHRMVDDNLNYRLLEFDKKFNRAGSLNRSIKAARGEFVVLVHSDVIVAQGWLTDMLRCIDRDATIGIVGPMTNKAEGIQKDINAVYPARKHFESYAKKIRSQNRSRRVPVKNLAGICLMFRHELIDHIGEFDEKFSSEAVTVKDFCLRAVLKGYKNFVAADVYIHHLDKHKNGQDHSAMEQIRAEDKKIFQEKFNALAIGNPEGKRLQGLKLLEQADELNQRGQVDEAVDILLNGIGICPDDLRIYLALAEILIKAGRHQDALDTLNEMPSKEPTDAMYLNQKKMQEDSHLQIEFSDSIFLRNLEFRKLELCGYSEEGLENYKKAAEYADCILSLNPLSATALNLKGVVAYRQNNRQVAQEFFIKSSESDPGYGEAYTNLGALKWEQGHQEEALELYERGFTLDPTDLDIATSYHSALSALGEYKHAESIVRNVTAMHLHNKKISYMLVDILIQQGKYDSAMPAIEAAIARYGVDDGILAAALKVRDLLGPEQVSKSRKRSAVSLCMIVKNEEHYLARCLASVKPIVDEMIVVDTGSADRTRDIAKVFGANVFDFEWAEDFAAARNFSISKASGGWIFIMDGDEVISPLDHGQFKKIVSTTPKVPVAFSILTRNYSTLANIVGWVPNDGQYSHEEAVTGWMPSVKVRLFYGKDQIWFEGAVHEMVDPVLKRKGIKIKRCSIPIHHYGRLNREKLDRKGEIYFEIGKKKLKEMGDDISATRELAIQATNLEKNEEAILLWQKFLALEPVGRMAAEAFINVATVYNRTGKYEEALSAAKQAMQHAPDLKEAIYNYALAELHLGNAEKTIAMLEDLLDKAPDYPPAQFIRAAAYCCGTKREKGVESLRKLKATPIGSVLVFSFLELAKGLISARRIEYALRVLVAAIENEMVNQELLNLFGECIKLKQEGRLAGNANMQFAGSQVQEAEYASAAR